METLIRPVGRHFRLADLLAITGDRLKRRSDGNLDQINNCVIVLHDGPAHPDYWSLDDYRVGGVWGGGQLVMVPCKVDRTGNPVEDSLSVMTAARQGP